MSTRETKTMTDTAKARKGRGSTTAEKVLTTGLATAACIGVVGLLGTRMVSAQEVNAAPAPDSTPVLLATPASTLVTSSSGMTQADLDAYATLLSAEKDRLDAYRAQLTEAAKQINTTKVGKSGAGRPALKVPASTPVVPAPAAKPAPKPKAPPVLAAPAPQSVSKGS
jgi:hypothetical protein